MEFRVLGPVEVSDGTRSVPLPAAKQRALLAILLLNANAPVSGDRLIDQLWDGRPPASARKVLQTYVSKLRRVVGESALITRPGGYELRVGPGQLDLHRFQETVAAARAAAPREAARMLRHALAEWRGPALADLHGEAFALPEIERLEGLRLAALEERIDADLVLGHHDELVVELRTLVGRHPLRERLRARLMLALYRSGRQAEALDVHREGRRQLVEELGIEPGPELRELEAAILRQDPSLVPDAGPETTTPQPPRRLDVRRGGGLPVPTSSFVGRGDELDVLHALLRRPDVRLVTLTGPGGAGKTRLAIEASVRAGDRFGDGVVFVDLTAVLDPSLVMGAVAEALGLREVGPRRAAEEVTGYLNGRRVLLVLDNFEQVLDAADVPRLLLAASSGVSVLVTSRIRLNLAEEYAFSVPALPLPAPGATPAELRRCDAAALFVERATSARPGFSVTDANGSDVAELCIRLDGLPLALELAAARLALLSPRGIVDRLARRLDLLRSTAPDVAPRHRTLRAALEWSHDLLPPPEQTLFAALGVFVGGFGVDAAETVAGDGELDVVDGVDSLLAASLLRPSGVVGDEPRFGMLETIREYALDRAAHSGRRAELRNRHARWCLDLAERAEAQLRGPDQLLWLAWLDAEHDNLRAAIEWAAEGGDPDAGLRTGAALWRFWQVRGHLDEGRLRLERLLGNGLGSAPARAAAELTVARCAFVQGDLAALERNVQSCVPVHRKVGDGHAAGFALMILGAATGTRGDTDRGLALLGEALDVARGVGDRWLEASCLGYLGTVRAGAGDLGAARNSLDEGLRLARTLGDLRCVGWMLITLGRIARAAGDRDDARARTAEALSVQKRPGDRWGISNALSEHAALALETGDHATARALLSQSVPLALTVHDRPSIATGLELLARLAAETARPDRAAQLLGCIGGLHRALNDPLVSPANADGSVATLRDALGETAFAEAWSRGRAMTVREAVAYAVEQDDPASAPAPA